MVERKLFSDEFLATVRTKDGEDYELDSFRVMVTTVDRCLTEKEYKRSIILEGGFKSWNSWGKISTTPAKTKAKASGPTGEPWQNKDHYKGKKKKRRKERKKKRKNIEEMCIVLNLVM